MPRGAVRPMPDPGRRASREPAASASVAHFCHVRGAAVSAILRRVNNWNRAMAVPANSASPLSLVSRRRVLAGAAALVLLYAGSPQWARARAATADARGFIDGLSEEVLSIIRSDMSLPQRQKRFSDLFRRAFDVSSIGRFVLGRHWQRLSPDEQKRYLDLFGDYVAAIYADQFSNYRGQAFRTLGARAIGEGESAVSAQIERDGPPIRMDFRVRDVGGAYRITDVAVENVSLIVTKRDEFSSVVYTEGVGGVMRRMQAALDNIQRAGG